MEMKTIPFHNIVQIHIVSKPHPAINLKLNAPPISHQIRRVSCIHYIGYQFSDYMWTTKAAEITLVASLAEVSLLGSCWRFL